MKVNNTHTSKISKVNNTELAKPNDTLDFIEKVKNDAGDFENNYEDTFSKIVDNTDGTESLVFLPLAKKVGKIYNVKGEDFGFSRVSGATYINKNGVTQTALPNEPRIDYSNGVGELLLEDARTVNGVNYTKDIVILLNGYAQAILSRLNQADIVVSNPIDYQLPFDRYTKIVMS